MLTHEQETELVIYLSRKTGWTLGDIRGLTPNQLIEACNELTYQESVDLWEQRHNIALLLAAIHNCIPGRQHTFEPKEFFDSPRPAREGGGKEEMDNIDRKAKKAGIIIPEENKK